MINVEDYTEDIKAIRETVNLMNMVFESDIKKVVAVDYLNAAGGVGVYKVGIPAYRMGLVNILVNRNNHKVIGLYGKFIVTNETQQFIGIKLDLATELAVIEVINNDGTVVESIYTGIDMNSYANLTKDSVTIGGKDFIIN